jgi:hypothetical protein
MEVKMFIQNSLDTVEKNVNDWLHQNHVSIHHITQSQCERQGKFVFVMSVFYDRKEQRVPLMQISNYVEANGR